jgi:nucleoside-diphosphate-sugar epimerase
MSVMITGINGMTGLHTAKLLLQEGLEVVGYDNNRNGELAFYPEVEAKIRFVWGDITHFGHLLGTVEENGVDRIIHLAALRNEVLYKTMPTELLRVNIGGLTNILELARIGKIKRVIFASSAAVYGKMDDPDQRIPEDAPLEPRGIYANSKAMCESLCRAYRNVYDVDVLVLRPSRVYGRLANLDTLEFGNPISTFADKLLRGKSIVEKSGADFGGDFTYIADLAFGCYRALVTPHPENWIYNISNGVFYRLSEVAAALGEIFPKARISIGPGMHPYITQSPIRGPLDISRAKKELSFSVTRDLKGSLEHFIENLRQRQGL